MGALIFFAIVCVATIAVAAIYNAFPSILNFIESFINWHRY